MINDELSPAIEALADPGLNERDRISLIEHVENLRQSKLEIVEKIGQRLAEKLGTKWYNEGEKSTRYFLRLLSRNNPDKFKELETETGDLINSPEEI